MSGSFYRLLRLLSRIFGIWIVSLTARGIAAGYYFTSPRKVSVSARFYRALYPEKNRIFHLRCAWKQFQNFTSVYVDRFLVDGTGEITCTHTGREYIDDALERATGGIILMSHLGNWEIAAHLLAREWENIRLALYMGSRAKKEIEQIQKEELEQKGVRIVAIEDGWETPLDLLEGLRFIQSGGLVAMAGDLVRDPDQQLVPVTFLGHEVRLPVTPFLLSMISDAPIFFFFSHRSGPKRYHVTLSEPYTIDRVPRSERSAALRGLAQTYANLLEQNLRLNPLEWYHFQPFLGPKL